METAENVPNQTVAPLSATKMIVQLNNLAVCQNIITHMNMNIFRCTFLKDTKWERNKDKVVKLKQRELFSLYIFLKNGIGEV